jgi:hypothetical protein
MDFDKYVGTVSWCFFIFNDEKQFKGAIGVALMRSYVFTNPNWELSATLFAKK